MENSVNNNENMQNEVSNNLANNENLKSDVNNTVKKDNKQGNNYVPIIMIVVGIVCLLAGIYLGRNVLFGDSDSNDNKKESGNNTENVGNNGGNDSTSDNTVIKAYSDYDNYSFTMKMTIGISGQSISTETNGVADVKNKTDYMITSATMLGTTTTSYTYDDYNNLVSYSSTDNINWYSEELSALEDGSSLETINISQIISKISNNDSTVTTLEKDHYNVIIDYKDGDVTYSDVVADVYLTDGYISKINYDLSKAVASEGYDSFLIEINLSKFNTSGDVIIPSNIVVSMEDNSTV